MTQPQPPGSVQIDMGQVLSRATQTLGANMSSLAAQYAMAQETSEALGARAQELEQQLAAKDIELGQLRQANELLQGRLSDLEGRATSAPAEPSTA